jgi:hypothetical protein
LILEVIVHMDVADATQTMTTTTHSATSTIAAASQAVATCCRHDVFEFYRRRRRHNSGRSKAGAGAARIAKAIVGKPTAAARGIGGIGMVIAARCDIII